jgi:small subunit ribosomal protein S1
MSYGAFVRLEDGIEGLVHISEMSWTRRINHPSEMVNVGEEVDVVVLDIDKNKQEISLGMKQTEVNPWELVSREVPRRHASSRAWSQPRQLRRVRRDRARHRRPAPRLRHVLDQEDHAPQRAAQEGRRSIALSSRSTRRSSASRLGRQAAHEDPWFEAVPAPTSPAWSSEGKVTKITNFGVFVELEEDLEGPAAHLRTRRPQGREPAGRGRDRARSSRSRFCGWTRASERSACPRSGRNGPRSSGRRRASRRRSSSVAAGCTVPVSRLPV